jgi:hypothetical protein
MIICVYEDRLDHLTGVKLTALSLARHCPNLPFIIFCPQPPASFCRWIEDLPNAKLVADHNLAGRGWNVKPTILLRCLEEGYPEVVWIDSDIIVNRDFRQRLSHVCDDTLVVTQDVYWGQHQGTTYRTIAWGLKPGRTLPTTVNTGVVRVTPRHTELLKAWQTMLNHPSYLHAQRLPSHARPLHMLGDQEVFTALLDSVEFAHVPVEMLERGTDIAQCSRPAGYTPTERLRSLGQGLPAFLHSMGYKPWGKPQSPVEVWNSEEPLLRRLHQYYNYVHMELSPYTSIAREYREELGEEANWMNVNSVPAKLFAALFAGHPTLQGLPLALFDSGVYRVLRLLHMDRRFPLSFSLESSPPHI